MNDKNKNQKGGQASQDQAQDQNLTTEQDSSDMNSTEDTSKDEGQAGGEAEVDQDDTAEDLDTADYEAIEE